MTLWWYFYKRFPEIGSGEYIKFRNTNCEYSEKAEKATYIAKAAEKRASALGDVLKRLKAAGVEVGEQDFLAISKDNANGGNRSVVRMLTTNKGRKDSPTTSKIPSFSFNISLVLFVDLSPFPP